jgi:hypothetical protein
VSIIACAVVEVSNFFFCTKKERKVFWHEKIFMSERDALAGSLSLTTAKRACACPLVMYLADCLLSAPSEFVTAVIDKPSKQNKEKRNNSAP